MTAEETESRALYVEYLKDLETTDADWVDKFFHKLESMEYERNHARKEAEMWRDLWAMKGENCIATAEINILQNRTPWEDKH